MEMLYPIGYPDKETIKQVVETDVVIENKKKPFEPKSPKAIKKITGGIGKIKTCGICHEAGHMTKTCQKKKDSENKVELNYRIKATEDDIVRIQELKESGMKSHEVAEELTLHLAEVNKHWVSNEC